MRHVSWRHSTRLFLLSTLVAAGLSSAAVAAGLTERQLADPDYLASAAAMGRALDTPAPATRARNVILFIGDGMGVSTVTAARILEGQARGVDGASNVLAFETLPYGALAKTYSQDSLVTDSANGATALLTGVKTLNGVIGLDGSARRGDCGSASVARVTTLAELAKAKGLATGVVTTTRLTDATPASLYAHTPLRGWESDADMPAAARDAGCIDIARQLVEAGPATRLDVAMGGGRGKLLPVAAGGERRDGRDLMAAWRRDGGERAVVVTTSAELAALDPTASERLLGVFAPDNMPYAGIKTGPGAPPSLTQMTLRAIEVLKHRPHGYFLVVEGGNIDKAHHRNDPLNALQETAELAQTVGAAMAAVDRTDTLIIVTADHSHGLVISGYPPRATPILGDVPRVGGEARAADGLAYGVLSYASGPGGGRAAGHASDREDHRAQALVPMASAAHSGEDVPVYAGGPGAQFVRGVVDQTYIFQVILRALGLGAEG